jgi:hypothetical protein
MNHAHHIHNHANHLDHMILCCVVGIGIGTLAVWGYNKIKQNKNHNP